MNNKKAVLIEFIDEADCLITHCEKHKIDIDSIEIIALSTKVHAYLNSKNINYTTTLDYLKNSEQETIIRKNEAIISHFVDIFPGPVSLTEDLIFYIRFYIYHYLWIIEILNNLKEKGLDSFIIIKTPLSANSSLIINDQERYSPLLCQKFCIENKLDQTFIENPIPLVGKEINRTKKILKKACEHLGKMNLGRISRSTSPLIAIYGLSYNFDRLFGQISNRHPDTKCVVIGETDISLKLLFALVLQLLNASPKKNIIYLPVNVFTYKEGEPDAFLNEIQVILNENFFEHRGISFKDELQEKVRVALIPYLIKLNNQKRIVDSILEKAKPELALSQFGVGLGRVIGESSTSHKVPSIFISHGSHKTPANEIEYIELFNLCKGFMLSEFRYAAISSPFVKRHFDYFKVHYPRMPARPLITGPLIYSKIDATKKKIIPKKESERIILHATTIKTRGTDRFYILETNDEFFSAVNDLIDVVNEMENVKLLVRFHPGYQLSEEEIRSLLKPSEKLLISLSGSFQDVLAVSDVLISYSSTAIEEALLNFVPVVLYDKWKRYNHLDAPEYKETYDVNCAYYAKSKDELKNCLELLLNGSNIINKDSYYRYIYKEDYNPSFYDFISKLLTQRTEEKI